MGSLTVAGIKGLSKPGRYSDGDNLYLQVSATASKSWLFIYRFGGKQREMGLGPYPGIGLADARAAASEARAILKDKMNPRDPLHVRKSAAAARQEVPTFQAFADQIVGDLESQWRNDKHRAQWRFTLREYGKPLAKLAVDQVQTEDVLKALKPIWLTKPETASRVRGRIEKVLDAATAKGLRCGLNPARWRGHLDHLLPKRQKLTRGHHAAMPYEDVPAFVAVLRSREAVSALALEFLILTAARSGEVLGMTWDEIDTNARIWTIPGSRMKAGREHRVPLVDRCIEILVAMRALAKTDVGGNPSGHVFSGPRGKALSVMAMTMQLRRMGQGKCTVHGFRSAFRDWCGEVSIFSREVAEAALAHTVGDATERAYRRGDALEKRRKLMDAWAAYIDPPAGGTVVALRAKS